MDHEIMYLPLNHFDMKCHIIESIAVVHLEYVFVNTSEFEHPVDLKFRWPKNSDVIIDHLKINIGSKPSR